MVVVGSGMNGGEHPRLSGALFFVLCDRVFPIGCLTSNNLMVEKEKKWGFFVG